MQLGVIFPQTEIGADPKAVCDFVQAAEGIGYEHVIVFDHVLGADTAHHQGWQGPYTQHDMFHEPFVLYGYLAAVTQRIELVTAVIILGQRQTALVAKQPAPMDMPVSVGVEHRKAPERLPDAARTPWKLRTSREPLASGSVEHPGVPGPKRHGSPRRGGPKHEGGRAAAKAAATVRR
jgi:hypothetical protein